VPRRFREFAELNSQIKQNMKGHHLRDVLPPLPDKPSKQFTDHKDLGFILVNMVSIPHVANMVCMKAFLGIMDQVCGDSPSLLCEPYREFASSFKTLSAVGIASHMFLY
jgi:hypothetical protein